MMGPYSGPFGELELRTELRAKADARWAAEVRRLYESGAGSLRVIAEHAGVSHVTVAKLVREGR
jgi:transposase-like protein